MKIYDENGKAVTDPDLKAGYLTEEQVQTGETAAIPEESVDAEYPDHPGMHYKKIVQQYIPPEPVYEFVQIYHPNPVEDTTPTDEERISALEDGLIALMGAQNV